MPPWSKRSDRLIAKIPEPAGFDLEDWLVSVLIDACDAYAQPGVLLAQLRNEGLAATTEEVEALAQSIVSTGLERGWLELIHLVPPAGGTETGLLRTLETDEAQSLLSETIVWENPPPPGAPSYVLTCTVDGEAHLDSIETEYD